MHYPPTPLPRHCRLSHAPSQVTSVHSFLPRRRPAASPPPRPPPPSSHLRLRLRLPLPPPLSRPSQVMLLLVAVHHVQARYRRCLRLLIRHSLTVVSGCCLHFADSSNPSLSFLSDADISLDFTLVSFFSSHVIYYIFASAMCLLVHAQLLWRRCRIVYRIKLFLMRILQQR